MTEEIEITNHNADPMKISPQEEAVESGEILLDPSKADVGIELAMPHSIYSSIIMLPLCESFGNTSKSRTMITLQILFCFIANLYVQITLLFYVYWIYWDQTEELGECGGYVTQSLIRGICVLIYTGYCIADFGETLKMFLFVYQFPKQKEDDHKYLQYKVVAGENQYNMGMSTCYKWFVYLFILFPKVCIASALLSYGTGFVVNTDEESDLILNALALGFVLDIDEMIYGYFLTFNMQNLIETLPPIQIDMAPDNGNSISKLCLVGNKLYGIIFKAFLLGGLTYATYNSYCPE